MNKKGSSQIFLLIIIAVILIGAVAYGYFVYNSGEEGTENTNTVVKNTNVGTNENINITVNTNAVANTNTSLLVDSRCEERLRTADCVDVATPGYWYYEESGGCGYTSGEVCSNPPFGTYDECMAACVQGSETNTNTSVNLNTNTATNENDKCDVGKDTISESARSDYDCESKAGCEWLALGGKIEMNYACCPEELPTTEDNIKKYSRCFLIID